MKFFQWMILVSCVFAATLPFGSTDQATDSVVYNVEKVKFEMTVTLNCTILRSSNMSDIKWLRNGKDSCTSNATWCSQEETKTPTGDNLSKLTLRDVLTNGNYTCLAMTSEGVEKEVSQTDVIVVPNNETRTDSTANDNFTIECFAKTPNLGVRLVRDGNETCTPGATWCSQESVKLPGASSKAFKVRNERRNQSYTCEAYDNDDDETIAIISVHKILIGYWDTIITKTPKWIKRGSFAVVHFTVSSATPILQRIYKIDGVQTKLEEYNLKEVYGVYTYYVEYGPVNHNCTLKLEVVKINSTLSQTVEITVAAEVTYGEKCNEAAECVTDNSECNNPNAGLCVCLLGYYWNSTTCQKIVKEGHWCNWRTSCLPSNTECNPNTGLCECRQGYHWDSTVCRENGVMGALVVRQEGIVMLVLATLLTVFRTTTSTAG